MLENVKMYRRKRGLSQQQLAKMVGVDRSYISKIENGKQNPDIDVFIKIALALNVCTCNLIEFGKAQEKFKINNGDMLIKHDSEKKI